jgi:hypothetical protein
MAPGMTRDRVPPGPFTVTVRSAMVTSTPLGTVIGDLPMRDTTTTSSPDEAQDLAAHAAMARLAVGHETLAGREHGDAQAAQSR